MHAFFFFKLKILVSNICSTRWPSRMKESLFLKIGGHESILKRRKWLMNYEKLEVLETGSLKWPSDLRNTGLEKKRCFPAVGLTGFPHGDSESPTCHGPLALLLGLSSLCFVVLSLPFDSRGT